MAELPWQTGSTMPWHLNQTFVDAQGVAWTYYADPASPSGYTLKRQDQNGVSYQTGPTPNDPNAAANAWEQSPLGQRYAQYEEGLARQNEFNNNIQLSTLDLKRQQLKDDRDYRMRMAQNDAERNEIDRWYKGELVRIADGELEIKRGGLDLQRGQLGLSTLELGASLRGPRDWLAYQRSASGASQNPMLTGAVDTWASLTGNKPSGLGAWGGGDPERMSLGALASDFGVGGVGANGSPYTAEQQTFMAEADRAARNPHQWQAGWWESKNPDQQNMFLGAWEELGHSPDTVLSRRQNTRINQSISGSRAA